MMKILIVRHAAAVGREVVAQEELRHLTAAGRKGARALAASLAKMGVQLDAVVTSPLPRAVQTADILAEGCGYGGEVYVSGHLSPGAGTAGFRRLVRELPSADVVAVVGHEPDLGEIVRSLLELRQDFRFTKGSVIALKLDPDDPQRGTFRWFCDGGSRLSDLAAFLAAHPA